MKNSIIMDFVKLKHDIRERLGRKEKRIKNIIWEGYYEILRKHHSNRTVFTVHVIRKIRKVIKASAWKPK
jgi:hypothetical protein